MDFVNGHWLSVLIFLPLIWGTIGLLIPAADGQSGRALQWFSLVGTLIAFAISVYLFIAFEPGGAEFQFTESAQWFDALGITYSMGIDGISLLLILLTTFLMPLVVLSSFTAVKTRQREYYFYLLALQTGMMGAFVALDIFLFYVFWEAMLIPMYLLVGIWGGKNRIYAAMKFFLYTVVGSLLMLVAIFYLAYQHKIQFGQFSTLVTDLYRLKTPLGTQNWLFLAFALAFAIKVPLFPLHTWLPDAHVEAPTAGSVILAGVLLKLGGYGFIRFAFPLFPQAVAQFQVPFLILGAIAIVYGAWVAMVQPDVKKLVAYSSVSHMGYVIIGLFSLNMIGTSGAVYQMLNHGISTGALFLLIGMIYERTHTREISAYGGITKVMPIFAIVFLIMTMSSIALPGTNGFIGEFLILLGTWQAYPVAAVISATGVVFGAVYMLWMFRRVMYGPITHAQNESLQDLSGREKVILLPLVIMVFVMGMAPGFLMRKMEPSVQRFLSHVTGSAAPQPTVTAAIFKGNP